MSTPRNGHLAGKIVITGTKPSIIARAGQPDVQAAVFCKVPKTSRRISIPKGVAGMLFVPGVPFNDSTIEILQQFGLLPHKPRIDSVIDMPKVKAELEEVQRGLQKIGEFADSIAATMPKEKRDMCASIAPTPLPDVSAGNMFNELNKHDYQEQNNIMRLLLQRIKKERSNKVEYLKRQEASMQTDCLNVSRRRLEVDESEVELADILTGKR